MHVLETDGLMGQGSSARAVWLGTEFVDGQTRDSTRKVILAATAMTVLQVAVTSIAVFQSGFHRRGLTSALVSLASGMLLPAFGYFGAVRSDSGMMCCFCGCSLCSALGQILLLAGVAWMLTSLDAAAEAMCSNSCASLSCGVGATNLACTCSPECVDRIDLLCCYDFAHVCLSEPMDEDVEAACDASGVRWATSAVAGILLVLVLPTICLSCYAWWHGLALWRRLTSGEHLTTQPQQSLGLDPPADEDGAE